MKKKKDYVLTVLGLLLLAVGLGLLKGIARPEGILFVLPYVCIGLGCGIFGYGTGNLVSCRVRKNNPELARQIEIEANDERNVMIAGLAKAKAYDLMIYVFGALMVSFALMRVEVTSVLLLVAAYLFVVGYGVYCRIKLEKEM